MKIAVHFIRRNLSIFPAVLIALCIIACQGNTDKSKNSNKPATGKNSSPSEVNPVQLANGLLNASDAGDLQTLEKLLKEGADVNFADENGSTALMLASFNGRTAIVELLIKSGAEVNLADLNNRTALIYASSGPFAETVEVLLKNDAQPNLFDNVEKWTALMFAAAEGNTEVVKVLLENGASKEMTDIDGESAYDFALANQHSETAGLIKDF